MDQETRALVLAAIDDLGRGLVSPARQRAWDESEAFPPELLSTLLGELGIQLAFLPPEAGGLGATHTEQIQICKRLGRLDLAVATSVLAVILGAEPIARFGLATQRKRWLDEVATGAIVAYAATEPEAGSNLAAIRTQAEPILRDNAVVGYRIDGAKQLISNGGAATFYSLLARTPKGPSFFVVERSRPGVQVGPPEHKHGIRASNTTAVRFDGVEIPVDHLLGEVPGQGLSQANSVFGATRLMVASLALGAGEQALLQAYRYAQERRQFGKPLLNLRGFVGKLLLPHATRLAASDAYIAQVAADFDRGQEDGTAGAMAKLYASESAVLAASAALQVHGGYGYIRDFHVEKILRDVRVTTIYEGTSEVLQNLIYVDRLRALRRSKGHCYLSLEQELRKRSTPASERLADQIQVLCRLVMELPRGRQEEQLSLANAFTELEHAVALCLSSQAGSARHDACQRLADQTAVELTRVATAVVNATSSDPQKARDLLDNLRLATLLPGERRVTDRDTLEQLMARL